MLDDVERQKLSEIDAWFQDSDPRLARRFARGPRRWWSHPAVTIVSIIAGLIVGVLAGAALAGPPAAIQAVLIVLAVVVGCRLQSRLPRAGQPGQE
jgi:Flp pilus assembly protein TadB